METIQEQDGDQNIETVSTVAGAIPQMSSNFGTEIILLGGGGGGATTGT